MEIKKEWLEHAKVKEEKYSSMYDNSLQNNDEFWANQAQRVDWIKKFTKVKESSFNDKVNIKWFSDGSLNASFNCIDRHLKDKGEKTAIIWESDDPNLSKKISKI